MLVLLSSIDLPSLHGLPSSRLNLTTKMGFAAFPSTYETLSPFLHERFVLLEEIGVGGSGFVLKVQRRQDERIFAAKLIARERIARSALIRTSRWGSVPPGFKAEEDGMLVVPVEAWAMRRVAHPNVCSFEELFADETFYYLVRAACCGPREGVRC